EELRDFLKNRLPDYMMPSVFVTIDHLPLLANGKIDRKALPAPDQGEIESTNGFIAPRNSVEQLLANIWTKVLGVKQVGIHDSFFKLGGDSILSLQIVSRANQAGLRLTPKLLFQHQTIAELAAVAQLGPTVKAEQSIVVGPMPLTPIQQWFFEQELEDAHHWN